ncbi:MAG TPA: TAXI family TRAP transporter solute-binding subunit [Verrucomicrobiae bacterium]|jgi:hypothetical protein|nr:TAXI family TRAP transporter solute-binding subunit [Verrucomicrobiae bacterium]
MDNDKKAAAEPKTGLDRIVAPVTETFGLSWALAAASVLLSVALLAAAVFYFFHSAPPRTLTISSGPPGSSFESFATNYQAILASNHVTLKIVESQGSEENLARLNDKKSKVDVGFVQGGITNGLQDSKLVSLGSITYQPMLIFYHGTNEVKLLSDFRGKRLALGPAGSGTRALATTLLNLNGVDVGSNATLVDIDATNSPEALQSGKVDAVFLMGDSASPLIMKKLLLSPGVQLFNFEQADGYARKITYLDKLELPMGSIDFGKNIPSQDVFLLGPTVELLAQPNLHPALVDLLLEAAKRVHGSANLLRKKDEFPAPLEHDFPISAEAERFYKSGKGFLYNMLPFWLASLVNRILVAFVPLVVLLIPSVKAIPAAYKWRIRMLIYRRYRLLLALERELDENGSPKKIEELLARLDRIEATVNGMKVPASFADAFYGLRGHIGFVRQRLTDRQGQN